MCLCCHDNQCLVLHLGCKLLFGGSQNSWFACWVRGIVDYLLDITNNCVSDLSQKLHLSFNVTTLCLLIGLNSPVLTSCRLVLSRDQNITENWDWTALTWPVRNHQKALATTIAMLLQQYNKIVGKNISD